MKKQHNLFLDVLDDASREIIAQALYYRDQSPDSDLEARWDRAVTEAILSLLSAPERGLVCPFRAAALQGMRRIPVPRFPKHFVFYLFLAEEQVVRIVHILHGARDLEALFNDASDPAVMS